MFKEIARRYLRHVKLKRRLPNGVQIYVSPDSRLQYLKGSFDLDLSELANRFVNEESVVWDIGANCGTMAFNASRAKQIVALEADPFLVTMLQDSTALNGVDIKIVAAAAFSRNSLAEFSIAKYGRASNHLTVAGGRSQTGGERARLLVPTISLDSLLEQFHPPTFLKIDVEGAEVEVLKGAARVLGEFKPVIYYEAENATADECSWLLQEAGYNVSKGYDHLNWLAIPR